LIVKNFNTATGAFARGTVTLNASSAVVTGLGTDWKTAGFATGTGRDVFIDNAGNFYTIQSVDSDTQLTLASNSLVTGGPGLSYTIIRYGGANGISDWDPTTAGGTNGGTFAKHNMGAAFNYNLPSTIPARISTTATMRAACCMTRSTGRTISI
jgi:hypothetical protein